MFCSKCGTKLPEGANVCPTCGEQIEKEANSADVQADAVWKAPQAPQASNTVNGSYQEPKTEQGNADGGSGFSQPQMQQNAMPVNAPTNGYANVPPNGYANTQPNNYMPQNGYPPAYVNMSAQQIPPEYKPISMWGYFGYQILFAIPIIGFIVLLVFAFGGTQNKNLKNYARSYFCMFIIILIIVLIAVILGGGLLFANSSRW